MFIRKIRKLSRSFYLNEGGNIAMMTALALFVIVGAVGMSLDISKGVNSKSRLGDATDALSIVLAKANTKDQADMRDIAENFIRDNYPDTESEEIEILSIAWVGDAVTVQLSNVSENNFGSFFDRPKTDVSVESTATFNRKLMDIAFVLDSTGSMGRQSSGGGTKMSILKSASNDMVDLIDEYSDTNVRMSVVPFAVYVNVGTSERNQNWANVLPDRNARAGRAAQPATATRPATAGIPAVAARTWDGCVGSRNAPQHLRVRYYGQQIPALYRGQGKCGTKMLPLTTNFNSVKATINALVPNGNTYAPAGLMWGWRTLDDGAPFAHYTDDKTEKVMILMTDGQNTVSKNGIGHGQGGGAGADQMTTALCDAIKDDDITIYTIAYEVNDTATRNMLQGCASAQANYFNARSGAQLKKAFDDIAATLIEVRISS